MPTLPSPSRVGYVFAGWYMDSSFSVPYVDGILYLYMKDVTLYAKWTKEELSASGVYDLEISSTILEDIDFQRNKNLEKQAVTRILPTALYTTKYVSKIPTDISILKSLMTREL